MTEIGMTWPQYLRHSCSIDGREVRMTPREAELCLLFMLRRGRPMTKPEIIEWLWPDPDDEPDWANNVINVFVRRLRKAGVPIDREAGRNAGRGCFIERPKA